MNSRPSAIPDQNSEKYAPVKNIGAMMGLLTRLTEREEHLPGFGVFYGYSGYGKTMAACYAVNKFEAVRIEVGDTWTKAVLLRAILTELEVKDPKGTLAQLASQVIERLSRRRQPLMIDEADKLVDKKMIELVREIQEFAHCPVILIGEEALASKLMRVERVHNRVLEWVLAQPCDAADTSKLAALYAPDIAIADDLIEKMRRVCDGRARRIVTTLSQLREWCKAQGIAEVDAARYGGGFATGQPPVRRAG
jgi:DNA transposition AAA+ family ATPase